MARLAINGFGRIGRLVLRAIIERQDEALELVTINDLADAMSHAWLLRHDSSHGRLADEVRAEGNRLIVGDRVIDVTSGADPSRLPHRDHRIDLVLECTGAFTGRKDAQAHIDAGATSVLIAGPAEDADQTIIFGLNEDDYEAHQHIISAASCTANCLALLVHILDEAIGIERALTRTIHGYTTDQPLLDRYVSGDIRRGRAAALSIIPVETVSPRAVGELIPGFSGRIDGGALRIPTPNVSRIELTFVARRDTSVVEVNRSLSEASSSDRWRSIFDYCDEPMISGDLNHSSASAVVDALATMVVSGNLVRVSAWYDNEWAYAHRLVDIAKLVAAGGSTIVDKPDANTTASITRRLPMVLRRAPRRRALRHRRLRVQHAGN